MMIGIVIGVAIIVVFWESVYITLKYRSGHPARYYPTKYLTKIKLWDFEDKI